MCQKITELAQLHLEACFHQLSSARRGLGGASWGSCVQPNPNLAPLLPLSAKDRAGDLSCGRIPERSLATFLATLLRMRMSCLLFKSYQDNDNDSQIHLLDSRN